jgi:hypothetical protein
MTDRERDKMSDQELDRILGDLAQEYRRPPEPPSDRIWQHVAHRIGEGVDASAQAHGELGSTDTGVPSHGEPTSADPGAPLRGGLTSRQPGSRQADLGQAGAKDLGRLKGSSISKGRPAWLPWGWSTPAVALATAAVVTFLLIQSLPNQEAPISDLQERVREQAGHESASTTAFALAAGSYLGRADALLTKIAQTRESGRPAPEIQSWSESLLLETRLLLDSPAAQDPSLSALLLDLELTLAQISQDPDLAYADSETEERDRSLLMRVRFKTPALTVSVGI